MNCEIRSVSVQTTVMWFHLVTLTDDGIVVFRRARLAIASWSYHVSVNMSSQPAVEQQCCLFCAYHCLDS